MSEHTAPPLADGRLDPVAITTHILLLRSPRSMCDETVTATWERVDRATSPRSLASDAGSRTLGRAAWRRSSTI